jgi:hypothetical protein
MTSKWKYRIFPSLPILSLTFRQNGQSRALSTAMEKGNPFQIEALQDFWLKCSETLRKLDLAVEMARRDAEEQVPKKLAESIALNISEWIRIAFAQFLSSEARSPMGIKDVGEYRDGSDSANRGSIRIRIHQAVCCRTHLPGSGRRLPPDRFRPSE